MAYDNSLYRLPDPNIDPNAPGFVSVGMRDISPGTKTRLNSGGSITVNYAGNYWEINIAYPELTIEESAYLQPIVNYIANGFRPIYIQLPQYINPKTGPWDESTAFNICEGNIALEAGTSNILRINSWSSRGGDLSVGDMVKFTNSHKVYQVLSKTILSDTALIALHCDLLEPEKLATAGFELNDLKFKVRLKDGGPSMVLTNRGFYDSISLAFEEDIL